MQPIADVASELGLTADHLETYGQAIAKVRSAPPTSARAKGRLVLVSAINPAPAGEGKTTVSVGLAMGLRRLGKKVVLALREPSLGPIFGLKGGATGGGKATLLPADRINLHFTGDLHAIGAANNLLAALVDNALHFKAPLGETGGLDAQQVTWRRAIDMNDRALRHCVIGLGAKGDGVTRQAHFDITAASEVMAILALARDHSDLEARLGRIVVGRGASGAAVTAAHLQAQGAMTALLRDAMYPNLVQTAEGGPVLVHCGPFANIAHGCNSVAATRMAQDLGDYAVTEAGFAFDLGGEKFLNIKCRAGGMWPRLVVLVASLRSLKMHGGAPLAQASAPNVEALRAGLTHLDKHVESVKAHGLPVVVALNQFADDSAEETTFFTQSMAQRRLPVACTSGFADGGEGALDLARAVCAVAEASDAQPPAPRHTYRLEDSCQDKVLKVATGIYGAKDVAWSATAQKQLKMFTDWGYGHLPICVAKTPASLSDDPSRRGRPTDFTVTVREVRLSAGAGFLALLTGDVSTMPGLPKVPASSNIRLGPEQIIQGL